MRHVSSYLVLASLASVTGCSEHDIIKQDAFDSTVEDAQQPDISIDPGSVSFGDVLVYDEAAPPTLVSKTLTIRNEGSGDLHLSELALRDPASGPFSWSALSAILVPAGEAATVVVSFDPSTSGSMSNALMVASDDPDEPVVEVPLDGTGLAPLIALSPTVYDFGEVGIGCETEAIFEISNEGTAELEVSAITLSTASTDLSLDGDDALPWILAPGEVRSVSVSNTPFDDLADVGYLRVDSDDPRSPTVMATLEATGVRFGEGVDVYEQPIAHPIDILFALDLSGSMTQEVASVQANFEIFIDTMLALDADYRIAAVVDDDGCINGPETWIDASMSSSEAKAVLQEMVTPNGSTRLTEAAFSLAEAVVSRNGPGDCNDGLLRDDAVFHMIGISDEPEQSGRSYVDFVSDFRAFKGAEDLLMVHGVGGDYPSGCATASAYTNLYEATVLTGGEFLSICAADWGTRLETLAESAAVSNGAFALSDYPVPETIAVTVDGLTLTRGWGYDPTQNAVVFASEHVPEGGSTVIIDYALGGDCED